MKTKDMLMYAAVAAGAYYLITRSKPAKAAAKSPAAPPPPMMDKPIPVDTVSPAQVDPVVDKVPMSGLGSLSGHVFR
jgi:hypothetical protein